MGQLWRSNKRPAKLAVVGMTLPFVPNRADRRSGSIAATHCREAAAGHERPYPEVTVSDRSLTPSTQTSHLCFSVRPRQGNRHFGHLPRVGKKLKVELKKGPRSRPRLSSSTPGLTLSSMKLTSIGVRHNT